MLISVALVSGSLLFLPLIQSAAGGGLSAAQVVHMINRDKAVVVDVCEAEEFAAGHVVGAKNLPLNELEDKLAGVVKNKTHWFTFGRSFTNSLNRKMAETE